jgi:DNA-binding transcriptional LysR family regulator
MPQTYDLAHLAHFFEVARRGSFTGAAHALRIQQPSVSRGVKLLEDALGVQLLDRKPRGVVLTPMGERVFAIATRLFEEASNIEKVVDEGRAELRGPLRIAAGGAVASRLAPDALASLVAAHPGVWPMVFSGPASLAAERIASGDYELGLYFYVDRIPAALEVRELVDVPFHLVVRKDRARHKPTLATFIGSREVESERARSFPTLDRLRRIVPEARIRFSTNDIEAHLRMVEAGVGVSVLPGFVVETGLASRRLADVLPEAKLRFPLLLVTRKGRVLSQAAGALVSAILSSLATRPAR